MPSGVYDRTSYKRTPKQTAASIKNLQNVIRKPCTQSTKDKLSKKNTGQERSQKTIKKIKLARSRQVMSLEHMQKCRAGITKNSRKRAGVKLSKLKSGVPLSSQHRLAIRKGKIGKKYISGRVAWNKDKTALTDQGIARNGINIGKMNRDKKHSEAWIKNIKASRESPAVRRYLSALGKEHWKDPKYRESVESKMGRRGKAGYFFSEKNNNNIYWRCSYEPIALQILENDPDVVAFKRCPFGIPYVYKSEEHAYYPDILVTYRDGSQKVIEVKAQWEIDHAERGKCIAVKKQAAMLFLNKLGIGYEIWAEKELHL